MMSKQILAVTCLLFSLLGCSNAPLSSTHSYESSKKHPYGLVNPAAPKEVQDFAPLIGECDCQSTSRKADGTWNETIPMTWRFKYIMNGMAIQDETLKSDGQHSGSIRQFDPEKGKWLIHYYASANPNVNPLPTWEGGKTPEGKLVFFRDQTAPNGMEGMFRLSFYDIDEKGFKWIGEWVDKAQKIVYPTWKIECVKRK